MIVKNESKIILRLLESVIPIIDSYCICDTGSTDNTIDMIRTYFDTKNLPGKIIEEPFRDFGYNRTYALNECKDMQSADYILLVDADMSLEINIPDVSAFKCSLTKDAYYVIQGSSTFYNQNIRIIRNDPTYHYWGVTHEYIELPDDAVIGSINKEILFINDIGDGGSKENKFHRDIELLKRGLETTPNNPRYMFYLANSYRDSSQYVLAIETYAKRIQLNGWIQETWHSYYSMANCYFYMNQYANAIYYWLEAYQYMPTRIENLYRIVQLYRNEKKYALALTFYELADRIRAKNPPHNHLFLENDIYEHKLDYEFSIIGYYTKINKTSLVNTCMNLLNKRNIQPLIYANILSNYKHYCPCLSSQKVCDTDMTCTDKNLFDVLENIGLDIMKNQHDMYPSTPSICENSQNPNEIFVCKRYVNYVIGSNGEYINPEKIVTKNVFAKLVLFENQWKKETECLMYYDRTHDDIYIGCEDVKIIHTNNNIIEYSANRVTSGYHFNIEYGLYDYTQNVTAYSRILLKNTRNECEKNWTIFHDNNSAMRIVYGWSPFTICERVDNEVNIIREIKMPRVFKQLRGSSNGVRIGNEVWFLCHMVSYEDRRIYYHMFVAIDATVYQPIKYSQLFTFNSEHVEYSLGFIYRKQEDRLLIGYSTNDNKTHFMFIKKSIIDDMFTSLEC